MKTPFRILCTLLFLLMPLLHHGQTIRYVKQGGTGEGNSWVNASGNLQQILNESLPGEEVMVSAGTYQAAAGTSFVVKEGVSIYGGFPATGNPAMADRDFTANETILRGNNKSVVTINNISTAILNGFAITGGSGTEGGGILITGSAATLENLKIRNNTATRGAGINVNPGTYGNSVFKYCTITDNTAQSAGGAINMTASASLTVENTTISNNISSNVAGGIYCYYTQQLTLKNVLVSRNTANASSGVFLSYASNNVLTNVTIAGNTNLNGQAGIFRLNNSAVDIRNSIIYDSSAFLGSIIYYGNSIITGSSNNALFSNSNGINNGGNMDTDPLFTDFSNGNYSPTVYSPARDAGSNGYYPDAATATDLEGNPRLGESGVIDIGAYEILSPTVGNIRYVRQGATGNGATWYFASGNIQEMINASLPGQQVWVAKGTYQPAAGTSYTLKEGVTIYGGFPDDNDTAGIETRNWKLNESVLQGNNSRVIVARSLSDASILDGFTITGGTAEIGAGILYDFSAATLRNLLITGNNASSYGGGIGVPYNNSAERQNPNPNFNFAFDNIIVKGNNAANNAGGINIAGNTQTTLTLTNCEISGNYSFKGGGIYLVEGKLKCINVVIASNSAYWDGALAGYSGMSPEFINCTITGNSAQDGAFSYLWDGPALFFDNCIIWNNYSANGNMTGFDNYFGNLLEFRNCIVEGGNTENNNLNTNPQFNNAAMGDFSLQPASPAINAGDTSYFPVAATNLDVTGNPRVYGSNIDIGAYEYKPEECGITTIWNGTSWSAGAAVGYAYRAVINGNYNSSTDGVITACSLIVDSGTVKVASGDVFTIKGAVAIDPSASLVLENNAHLIQSGSTNANTGVTEVHRNSSALFRQDYTLWSSPVQGQGIRNFSVNTVLPRFYTYNTATDHYESMFATEQSAAGQNFETGKGYLIRMPNGAPEAGYVEGTTAVKYDGVFTGIPNNGAIAVAVTPATDGVPGYNAIGNPYPSPILISEFLAGNSGSTDGTIYLWRRKNAEDSASAYSTVNADGDFVTSGDPELYPEAVADDPNGVLQTGQGFIIKALESTIYFNNDMRSGSANHDSSFFRMSSNDSVETECHRVWLNLKKGSTRLAQMLVGYKSNATIGIDMGIDALFINDVITGLNSVIDGKAYAIQGRPLPFDEQDVVPLEFKTAAAGEYTIAIDHMDGMFLGNQDIYLRDNLLAVTHDLKTSNYNFTSDAGIFGTRFELVYTNNMLGADEPKLDANSVIIYAKDKNVVINSGTAVMANVKIYDTMGRLVYEKNNIDASNITISDLRAAEQVLIVQVTTTQNLKVSKKIIF